MSKIYVKGSEQYLAKSKSPEQGVVHFVSKFLEQEKALGR